MIQWLIAACASLAVPALALAGESTPPMPTAATMPSGMEDASRPYGKLVLDFYRVVVEQQQVKEGTERYTSADYVSHARDPKTGKDMTVGRATGIEMLTGVFQKFPDLKEKVVRVSVLDDLVFTQVVQTGGPVTGARLNSTIKRIKDGKIAEHWVLSSIPLSQAKEWQGGSIVTPTAGMEDATTPDGKLVLDFLDEVVEQRKIREGTERYTAANFTSHGRNPQTGADVAIDREAGITALTGMLQKFPDLREKVVRVLVFDSYVFTQQVQTGGPVGVMLTSTLKKVGGGKITDHWVLSFIPLAQAAEW